jgi:hypothetical protein
MGRVRIIAGVAGVLLLASGGVAAAAAITSDATSTNVISGCVNDKTDVLTVLAKSSAKCPKGTTAISWNKTGPARPAGPSGTTGIFGTGTNKASTPSSGTTNDEFLGQVILVAGSILPPGTVPCDGQILAINTNTALFSLLGKEYGGNGTTTFALPNLKKSAPDGLTYAIAVTGIYP